MNRQERAIEIVNRLKSIHNFLAEEIAIRYSLTYCIYCERWTTTGVTDETGCCESCEICKD